MAIKTVTDYLAAQHPDRRAALTSVIRVMNDSVQKGFVSGIVYGMPSCYVPLSRYLALDVIAETVGSITVDAFLAVYEASRAKPTKKAAPKKAARARR